MVPPEKEQKIRLLEFQDPTICQDAGKISLWDRYVPRHTGDGQKVSSKTTDIETTQEEHLTLPAGTNSQEKVGTILTKELEDKLTRRQGASICSDTGYPRMFWLHCSMLFPVSFENIHVCPTGKSMALK